MNKKDGKLRFWRIMFEDKRITKDEHRLMVWYKKLKEKMERDSK